MQPLNNNQIVMPLIRKSDWEKINMKLYGPPPVQKIHHEQSVFQIRSCNIAVLDERSDVCKGCKRKLDEHKEGKSDQTVWSPSLCKFEPTNAYGKLKFPGSYSKTANYVKIDFETKIDEVVKFLYGRNDKGWQLQMPQLIISVTGGAQQFSIPLKMRSAFKNGLIKAGTSTNAWILTGGTNTGVMKLVGEAVAESMSKLTVIGIASWGKIAMRQKLVEKTNRSQEMLYAPEAEDLSSSVALDPNHTHFILVDDGSNGEYGVEIPFRAALQNEISKGHSLKCYAKLNNLEQRSYSLQTVTNSKSIPIVLLVVQGGPNTLLTVYESMQKQVPVLVLAESKGCADLISQALSLIDKSEESIKNLIIQSKLLQNPKTERKSDIEKYNKRLIAALEHLKYIVEPSNTTLINVFRFDSSEGTQDIELTILRALLNSRKDKDFENLKLALKWDRFDIAKNEIFTGEEKFHHGELSYLLEIALLENRPKFVKLLLENSVNLYSFLTYRRLIFLYNSEKVKQSIKKSALYQLLNPSVTIIKFETIKNFCMKFGFENLRINFLPKDFETALLETFLVSDKEALDFLLNYVPKFLKEKSNFIDSSVNQFEDNRGKFEERITHPIQNLFLWALLHDRIEIAKIFWQIGQHQICNALFASALFRNFSLILTEKQTTLVEQANYFENLAVSVLNIFDLNADKYNNGIILLRVVPYYGIDSLEMAVEANCKKFVSQASVQILITDIWNSKIDSTDSFKDSFKRIPSYLSLGFFAPFFLFTDRDEIDQQSEIDKQLHDYVETALHNDIQIKDTLKSFVSDYKMKRKRNQENLAKVNKPEYFSQYLRFMLSPRTKFTYMMLCDFNYHTYLFKPLQNLTNSSLDLTNYTVDKEIKQLIVKTPNWIEYLMIGWVWSYFWEEIRQLISLKSSSFRLQIKSYLRDNWNYLDITGCLVFSIGMIVRFFSFFLKDESLFIIARLVLCVDLWIWYVRILHVSLIIKSLGPKLVMIRKMLKDLMFFVTIIAIFVCAFGVTTQALLYPENELNLKLFMNIFHKAYWPIYGEIKVLEEDIKMNSADCDPNKMNCSESIGTVFTFFALMIYMVIANVLLINLLIAMFSSTFQKLQANTNEIWRFQRYRLVFEYLSLPSLPPPFVIFSHMFLIFRRCCIAFRNKKSEIIDTVNTINQDDDDDDGNISLVSFTGKSDPFLEYEKRYSEIQLREENEKLNYATDNKLQLNTEKLGALEDRLNEVMKSHYKEINKIQSSIREILDLLQKK